MKRLIKVLPGPKLASVLTLTPALEPVIAVEMAETVVEVAREVVEEVAREVVEEVAREVVEEVAREVVEVVAREVVEEVAEEVVEEVAREVAEEVVREVVEVVARNRSNPKLQSSKPTLKLTDLRVVESFHLIRTLNATASSGTFSSAV
jgi:hypothetical protein